tara:strand:- start:721 stop:831 length:111 start_codon:yes stop_codon:yes gene_type:complete
MDTHEDTEKFATANPATAFSMWSIVPSRDIAVGDVP